jgi:hydrogenase small subunit
VILAGCMGLADYLGWDSNPQAHYPLSIIPGCPAQLENLMETLTWVLNHAAG